MIIDVLPEQLLQLIAEELNVKEVNFVDDIHDLEGLLCVNSREPDKFFRVKDGEKIYGSST